MHKNIIKRTLKVLLDILKRLITLVFATLLVPFVAVSMIFSMIMALPCTFGFHTLRTSKDNEDMLECLWCDYKEIK